MQLASFGLSFIALFLCDERASIRKLKMCFAFRELHSPATAAGAGAGAGSVAAE